MKLLIRLAIPLLVLIAASAIALNAFLPSATKAAVQYGSQAALGVEATIEEVPLSLSSTTARVGLSGLEIPNPAGFGLEPFLRVGHASVAMDTFSVLKDVIQIQEIRLEGTKLHLVQKGAKSNLHWFLKRLSPTGEPSETTQAPKESSEVLLAVKQVVISGLTAALSIEDLPYGVGSWEVTLPPIALDLSKAEPGDSASLVQEILRQIVAASLDSLKSDLPPEVWQVVSPDSLQGLLNEALEGAIQWNSEALLDGLTGEAAQKVLGEALENLPKSGSLKDLFKN